MRLSIVFFLQFFPFPDHSLLFHFFYPFEAFILDFEQLSTDRGLLLPQTELI